MDIAQIKNSKEYRLTKIEVLHLYFETKQMNEILLKQLADANAGKKPYVPDKYKPSEPEPEPEPVNNDKLQIIIEPGDNEPQSEEPVLELQELVKDKINKLMNVISDRDKTISQLDKEIHNLKSNEISDNFREEIFKLGLFNKEDDTQINFTLEDLLEQMKEREKVYDKYWQDMDCMEEKQEAWDKLARIEEIHNAFHNLICTKF